jgi:hypothetical protein
LKCQEWRGAVEDRNKRRFKMIVQRITANVKIGCMDKLIELFKTEAAPWIATWDQPPKWRLYTPNLGKWDRLAWEVEFKNFIEYDRFWTAWLGTPEFIEYSKRWDELVETGLVNEIWDLVE